MSTQEGVSCASEVELRSRSRSSRLRQRRLPVFYLLPGAAEAILGLNGLEVEQKNAQVDLADNASICQACLHEHVVTKTGILPMLPPTCRQVCLTW
jgi:hypothetical protein